MFELLKKLEKRVRGLVSSFISPDRNIVPFPVQINSKPVVRRGDNSPLSTNFLALEDTWRSRNNTNLTTNIYSATLKRGGLVMNKILFIIGLVVCGIAAGLLFLDMIESGVAAIIGIVGIGLIASSAFIKRGQQ